MMSLRSRTLRHAFRVLLVGLWALMVVPTLSRAMVTAAASANGFGLELCSAVHPAGGVRQSPSGDGTAPLVPYVDHCPCCALALDGAVPPPGSSRGLERPPGRVAPLPVMAAAPAAPARAPHDAPPRAPPRRPV